MLHVRRCDCRMRGVVSASRVRLHLRRFHDQEFQRVGPDGRKRPPPAEGQAKLQLGKVVERGW